MRNNGQKGFTLIELIIYIVIFAVVATLGTSVFNLAVKEKITISASNDLNVAETQALAIMLNAVHLSSGINGASSTLSLAMASSSINPTIFSFSNGAVMMKQGSGAAAAITPSTITVTGLTFTLFTNPTPSTTSVQITLTAGYNKNGALDASTLYTVRTTALPG